MAVIGELLVEINGDNSGLKKSLNESGTAAKSGIDKLVGTIGLAGAAWKAVDLAMKGIDYNKAAEQAEIAFGVFLGSAEAAKNMIEEMRDLAKETPLEFADVRDAGLKLQAFGVATEKIIPSMRMLSDVSAGLQIPIKDLAYLFGSVQAQGKAMTVDLMQFANRGIPIWTELAKVTGVSGSALKKMVEEGKIGFPQVEQAFKNMTSEGGKFFNMAVKQMDSLAGSQSNLNDSFDVWLGLVTSGLTGPLKGLQDWASNWFATNTAQLKQNGKEWEDLFDGIAKATGWGKYNKSVREHWSDVITSMRLTAVEQEKLLGQAIDIAQKYPEIHKKNNGDILKTVSDISKLYGLSKSDVEKILLNVIDVDKASKTILEKDLARGDAGKEILATAQNYDELQKSGAKDAAKFAAERKAQQDNFNAAFQAYSDKFDTFVEKSRVLGTDEEERLKGQIKLRNEYKENLFEMYDKGLISQKAMTDEIARVNGLNYNNIKSLDKIQNTVDKIVPGMSAILRDSGDTAKYTDEWASSLTDDIVPGMSALLSGSEEFYTESKKLDELWKEIGFTVANTFNAISSGLETIGTLIKNAYDDQITQLTGTYDEERERIENNGLTRKEALEKNLSDASSTGTKAKAEDLANIEERLKAAKEAGDEELVKKTEIEKAKLENTIAAENAAAVVKAQKELDLYNIQEEFERKKANLQYQSAMASWRMQVVAAAASVAEASLNAFKSSAAAGPIGLLAAPGAAAAAGAWAALARAPILASMPQPPAFADGTDFAPGGLALVGERGPELVELPRGSRVNTAEETARMGRGGNSTIQIYLDSRIIAESTVNLVDNGVVKMRSLAR